jgi:hypothetical protein
MGVMHGVRCVAIVMATACSVPSVIFTPPEDVPRDGGPPDGGDPDGRELDAGLPGGGTPDGGDGIPATARITISRGGAATGVVSAQGLEVSCTETCTETVAVGTSVTLVAMPGTGAVFGGWSVEGCAGSDVTCTVTVTQDLTISARFDVARFIVEVNVIGNGGRITSISEDAEDAEDVDCTGSCAVSVPYNTRLELFAAPTAGSAFARWGAACSNGGRCLLTITADTAVSATFTQSGRLFMINDRRDRLERLDPDTLAITDVGPLGITYGFGDCAWNPADSTLYVVDGRGALYRVNLQNGAATQVGVHGIDALFSLAYHPPNETLYGISGSNRTLYKISTIDGAATPVELTALTQLDGLAWDSRRTTMMVASRGTSSTLFSINVVTGVLSAPLVPADLSFHGLTYDPIIDRLWAVDIDGVFQFDPSDGFARTAMQITTPDVRNCIAFVPDAPISLARGP